ncbi:MAG: hypothetical protein OXF58_03585 [Gammaproteobacteria bacterium]|nr:hypothetical protein [Gammaproteobacteria bacterium]
MVWELGQKPITRNFEDFTNIARARADATLHVDGATGQLRVTDRENPFQRMITWVRDKLHAQSQPGLAQTRHEEVRGAYNRFLQAVSAEHRYRELTPWLEDTLGADIMAADPKPLTTRKIRDLTMRLDELARNGAETRLVADYFSGREGNNSLQHILEDEIAQRPALAQANFELSGAEVERLSDTIHAAIMTKFRTDRQEVGRQDGSSIAAQRVNETLAAHEQRLLAAHAVANATQTATRQPDTVVPEALPPDTGTASRDAGQNRGDGGVGGGDQAVVTGAPDRAAPVQQNDLKQDTASVAQNTPARSFARRTIKQMSGRFKTFTNSRQRPADARSGSATVSMDAASRSDSADVTATQPPRQKPQTHADEPLRRSFIRRKVTHARQRLKSFSGPVEQPHSRDKPQPDGGAQPEGKVNEGGAGSPGAEQTGSRAPESTLRRSFSLRRGSARRRSKLAASARPSAHRERSVTIDKARLAGYLKDIELPKDVRGAVKVLVRDGSVRNYQELFEAVNKATFEWACANRLRGWYGEALKGQNITHGKNQDAPADLVAALRARMVSDREALDYPNFKQQARLLIGKFVLGQPL